MSTHLPIGMSRSAWSVSGSANPSCRSLAGRTPFPSMRIALDLTPLVTTSARRGIGRYVRGLVQGLAALGPSASAGLEFVGLAATPALDRLFLLDDLSAYCETPAAAPVRN